MTLVFLHLTSYDLNLDSTQDGSIFYKNMGLKMIEIDLEVKL